MNNDEKLALYNIAKEQYYKGEPIMGDTEFDELEKSLGLENKSYIGGSSSTYTVKHPFCMGSLSKVQVKEDKDRNVAWHDIVNSIIGYVCKNNAKKFIITPKYDGCSFEAVITDSDVVSVSSRGDGLFGVDLSKHLEKHIKKNIINKGNYVIRGEVLIDKSVFDRKYKDAFSNTRSFVAGLLNRTYCDDLNDQLNDLSIVIYDYKKNDNGKFVDIDWNKALDDRCNIPSFYMVVDDDTLFNDFESIYNKFDEYRVRSEYSLDGFVIKPTDEYRIFDENATRPADCVAVKFKPQIVETTVVGVEWKLGKTMEYSPVVIVEPVVMDGKVIKKSSGFNYGYMVENKVSKGTKLKLSLAGDIIPYIYEIVDTTKYDPSLMNIESIDKPTYVDGVHLMARLTDEERNIASLLNSIKTSGIKGFGDSNAMKLVEYLKEKLQGDEFFGIEPAPVPSNILFVSPDDVMDAIGGKTGKAVANAMSEFIKNIKLSDIIRCANFPLCGDKVSVEIANMLLGKKYDFSSQAKKAYEWAMDQSSEKYRYMMALMQATGHCIDSFKEVELAIEVEDNRTKVILTGEPSQYASKAEFLRCNPQYAVTTKWSDVQILFTNSLDSTTGKMKKAKEKGVEIRIY